MKIALDATVVHGRKSGVGYYCQELVRALVGLNRADDYFVFSHRPLSADLVKPDERVRFASARFCPVRAFYIHALLPGLLAEEKPDLVHYTNFLAPIRDSHPYVVTIHDMSLERLRTHHPVGKRVYTRRLVPYVAERARLIITNSEFSKWDIVRYLAIPESRIRVTPLGVGPEFRQVEDPARGEVLRRYGLDRPYFLYVGNIEPRKNLPRLIEAFASIPGKDHALVIVGDPWYRGSEPRKIASSLGLGDRVRFLGYVPRPDLPGLLGGATAFVYPSLLEGFGLPILEAMACGRPVITSATSGLAEVAGDAAILVDPLSIPAIAAAMTAMVEDASLAADLSRRSLRRAAQFSWRQTAESTRDVYLEATGLGAARSSAVHVPLPSNGTLEASVRRTLDYAACFDYPLTQAEVCERLFDVQADEETVGAALERMGIPTTDGFVGADRHAGNRRLERERASDSVIAEAWSHVETLARFPFVRMLALSGASAHRNMRDDDLDLFAVVEDGKLWATLLAVTVWAKLRGLRRTICLNYIVSDRALALFDTDPFTAQQAASLKPVYGFGVYDRFVAENPFIRRQFPNFDPVRQRSRYRELSAVGAKVVLEGFLRAGPVQLLELFSRAVFRPYLRRKAGTSVGAGDVLLGHRWIKLHLFSHKQEVLDRMSDGKEVPLNPQRRREFSRSTRARELSGRR